MESFFTEYNMILISLAGIFGLLMAFGIGANDVANAMGTSVGSKALTIKQAIIIAMVFEFAGAFLAGGEVTSTIRKGIIDAGAMTGTPELLVFGMMASLLAAGIWLIIATYFGWPVSTTHSIVGAIVGFAAVGIGMEVVKWGKVGSIVASWVVSPVLSGTIAFMLFTSVQKLILNTDDPLKNAKKYVPFYMFLAGFMIALVTLFKGLKHVGVKFESPLTSIGIAIAFGILVMFVGKYFISRQKATPSEDKDFHYASVERVFAVLMVVTACGMAFAHGSNDVANAIGPLAAVVSVVESGGEIAKKSALPIWILLVGGFGIVVGLAIYGRRVMATIGKKITELTPSRGFAAELAAASTVVIASGTGLPISTTHTLVGAVLGVGMARGIAALNLAVLKNIAVSWVVTLPAGAILSMLFFFMFKGIFL
ncbi:inorganic phosphate transporter [Aliikangiella sp. G2MR2-5]|uniref:inorganic phosphate transporter n=1 Tax=Aliikangiella sp. G2MR2-5 TaxID=2788943 RepID=UPI0018AB3CF5|nr:inorganic phosphate transporter [Aliikangiella sp. G2MR2-5]